PDRPHVNFGCGQQAAVGFVRRAVLAFHKQHRQSRLRISTARGATRIERVANGSLDLATVDHDDDAILKIARRPLHIETLCRERFALVSARKKPWSDLLEALPETKVSPKALMNF